MRKLLRRELLSCQTAEHSYLHLRLSENKVNAILVYNDALLIYYYQSYRNFLVSYCCTTFISKGNQDTVVISQGLRHIGKETKRENWQKVLPLVLSGVGEGRVRPHWKASASPFPTAAVQS
jgi:hypothetical protein